MAIPQHRSQEARPKVEEEARPKVFGHAHVFIVYKTCVTVYFSTRICFGPVCFGESGLLENEPTAPAEQAHTTQRQ